VAWDPSWLTAPLLGSGSFGDVRAGTVRPYGPVAIKLPREFGSVRAFRDEVAALAAVSKSGSTGSSPPTWITTGPAALSVGASGARGVAAASRASPRPPPSTATT
jgi:hypothetical protein